MSEGGDLREAGARAERIAFERAGRLHWFHWSIVAASLLLTITAWWISKSQVEAVSQARFDREATRVVNLIEERMELYEAALWSGVAAIQAAGGDVTYDQWHAFSESLQIDVRYPGINGIGVIDHLSADDRSRYLEVHRARRPDFDVRPAHREPELWPIRFVEPIGANAKAVGLDIGHEVNRRRGAEKARDSGAAQITGPIVLVQDAERTPGFLFYAPVYRNLKAETSSLAERRAALIGLVYAPFIVEKLLEGTLSKEARYVRISIADAGELIYDEHVESEVDHDPDPILATTTIEHLYGREWVFDIRSARSFRGATTSNQPAFILAGGVLIDSLLLSLFILLSRANRKTIAFADRATEELQKRTLEVERSNEDLEKFAYVASHDLKTPLRGISDLAEYLEEDLEDYLASDKANPKVSENLSRIGTQVSRMDRLIKGILEYSSVGTGGGTQPEALDIEGFVRNTMSDLGCSEHQWEMRGAPRHLETLAVPLTQVLGNLLGNAVKYHDEADKLRIVVSVEEDADAYRFSVADNGPGIAPRFHRRIFEAFQTLQSKDVVDSTGIGLAIVKKNLEAVGGSISVDSREGEGATFTFDWPKRLDSSRSTDGF